MKPPKRKARSKKNRSELPYTKQINPDSQNLKKGEISLEKPEYSTSSARPEDPLPTDAYLARAAALKFELQNYTVMAPPK